MIPAALIGKLSGSATGAAKSVLTGDLAVVRYTKKGKGKGSKKKPDKDVELHVNPVSLSLGAGVAVLAIGGAATLAAIALWMSGMGLSHDNNAVKLYTIRNRGTVDKPDFYLYSQRGLPVSHLGSGFNYDTVLSQTRLGQGWKIDTVTKSPDGTWFGVVAKNANKGHWSVQQRGRFGISLPGANFKWPWQ